MLVISKEDVKRLMPVSDAIGLVGKAYVELSKGSAEVPDRIGVSSRGENGMTLIMPGYLGASDGLAVKMVSIFPNNTDKNLPVIHATVVVFDPETGVPAAIIEGGYLTALRTGASCGLATDLLARQDARTVAIIGAGAQSRLIIPAVCAVRSIETVLVYDVVPAHADTVIDELTGMFDDAIELVRAPDPSEAVMNSDIVCTATTSKTPVFDGAVLAEGTHINGIGSFTAEMQEVGLEAIRRCGKVVVDSINGAMIEAGDILKAFDAGIISRNDIYCEIGSIVDGSKPGRENNNEITFFKSVGNAALDVAVGAEIYRRASANGAGTRVDL